MSVRRVYGNGRCTFTRYRYPAGALRGCLLAHGATSTSAQFLSSTSGAHPLALTERLYVCLADDFAGAPGAPLTDAWANDAVVDPAVGSAKAALDALEALGAVGPHDAWGFSMGGLTLVNMMMRSSARLRRLFLVCPVLDLADMHDNDRGAIGLAASIETAYGGLAGYNANVNAHNPSHAAAQATIAGLIAGGKRITVCYSTNDTLCPPAIAQSWCAAVGATAVSLGDVGHYVAPEEANNFCDFLWAA